MTAMGRNPSADLQESGCSVLDDLVRFSDLQQRIKRAGAGEAVRRAMAAMARGPWRHGRHQDVGAEGAGRAEERLDSSLAVVWIETK